MDSQGPVLRENHEAKLPHQIIDRRNHRVRIRHGKRTAEAKIILDVDDDEGCGHVARFTTSGCQRPLNSLGSSGVFAIAK